KGRVGTRRVLWRPPHPWHRSSRVCHAARQEGAHRAWLRRRHGRSTRGRPMKRNPLFTAADFTDAAPARAVAGKASAGAVHPAYTAWAAGASIRDLVAEHGGSRSSMRKILTAGAGGTDAFRALRAQGAGGTSVPFGGKRSAGGRTGAQRTQDDHAVPHITKAKGWTSEHRYKGVLVHLESVGDVKWREE